MGDPRLAAKARYRLLATSDAFSEWERDSRAVRLLIEEVDDAPAI